MTSSAARIDYLRLTGLAVATGIAVLPTAAMADVVAPIGLTPGADYRILFITLDGIAGTSSHIATYDAFAASEAALSATMPSLTWQAVLSTVSVSAVDHVSCIGACASAPIYSTAGVLLANNQADLFANGTFNLGLPVDQYGNSSYGLAWSGSNNNGTPVAGAELGTGSSAIGGWGYYGPSGWLYYGAYDTSYTLPIYALSGDINASPTATPEPASLAILAAGIATLAAARSA